MPTETVSTRSKASTKEPPTDSMKEEKKEEDALDNKADSKPPAVEMTNAPPARPPSSASVHSVNSTPGPAARTTATSRRGGRTRSRSPPSVARPASTNPTENSAPAYSPVESTAPEGPSGANPSAAAAAAAAAAKSLAKHPPPPPSSYAAYPSPSEGRGEYQGHPPPHHQHYYGEHPSHRYPPHHRPHPEDRSYRGGAGPSMPPSHGSSRGDMYGYREGYYGHRPRGPYEGSEEYDRRYYSSRGYRAGTRPHPGVPYGEDKRSASSTRAVFGSTKPIHVPRAPADAASAAGSAIPPASAPAASSSRRGDTSSVFRGRPGETAAPPPAPKPAAAAAQEESNSPQKILMSLRTPTSSFDEKVDKTEKGNVKVESPPQIQHSHQRSSSELPNLDFDPQRSPKSQSGGPIASLDMAPSFSLFNQSFDSFGDAGQYLGSLDLQASFGMPGIKDDGGELQLLKSSMSGTTQQLLGGSSSGGALTFGMSPNNSFGNPAPTSRGSGMMILGDGRSASPTQVLGMYGGAGSPKPSRPGLEDSHLRMSASMGGPPYGRSFGEGYYRRGGSNLGMPDMDGSPHFYRFLKKYRQAFKECSFLLPGLKRALLEAPDVSKKAQEKEKSARGRGHELDSKYDPSPLDTTIATRRVASAVCAFGGCIMGERASLAEQKAANSSSRSIFRDKKKDDGAATVTPSSSANSHQASYSSRQRVKYDERLPSRYYENDNRLSWEFEENPPVESSKDEEAEAKQIKKEEEAKKRKEAGDDKADDKNADNEEEDQDDNESDDKDAGDDSTNGDQPKMRYRCKLCGQPKQNHTCPYQQSLARSIGTMVYPAVNAFTASEPGKLAPALSEMNNFVSGMESSDASMDTSPSRPTPDRRRRVQCLPVGSAQVTPESLRGATRGTNSPIAGMSSSASTPRRGTSPSKKRSRTEFTSDDQAELLFVAPMDIKPEQYRMVSPSKITSSPEAFTYPALPLPYAQRKRLSDNLYSMSKEIPQLSDECAAVLREAREKDSWDTAVAELMAQVCVLVHCHDGDARFEGLRRYLLTLGIAC